MRSQGVTVLNERKAKGWTLRHSQHLKGWEKKMNQEERRRNSRWERRKIKKAECQECRWGEWSIMPNTADLQGKTLQLTFGFEPEKSLLTLSSVVSVAKWGSVWWNHGMCFRVNGRRGMRGSDYGHFYSRSFAEKPRKRWGRRWWGKSSHQTIVCLFLITETTACVYADEKVSAAREKWMVKKREGGTADWMSEWMTAWINKSVYPGLVHHWEVKSNLPRFNSYP